jgi:hypothetical protein
MTTIIPPTIQINNKVLYFDECIKTQDVLNYLLIMKELGISPS